MKTTENNSKHYRSYNFELIGLCACVCACVKEGGLRMIIYVF